MGQDKSGLPDHLKAGLEKLSGMDLGDVKVHYNSHEPTKIGAQAFSRGAEIFVGPGQEKHLAHELSHVVQQRQGRVKGSPPPVGLEATGPADGQRLEARAEAAARKATAEN